MNRLLEILGARSFCPIPEQLPTLLWALGMAVLREQPENICEFAADYLEQLVRARDGGHPEQAWKDDGSEQGGKDPQAEDDSPRNVEGEWGNFLCEVYGSADDEATEDDDPENPQEQL